MQGYIEEGMKGYRGGDEGILSVRKGLRYIEEEGNMKM
jgi:hypothetical protein